MAHIIIERISHKTDSPKTERMIAIANITRHPVSSGKMLIIVLSTVSLMVWKMKIQLSTIIQIFMNVRVKYIALKLMLEDIIMAGMSAAAYSICTYTGILGFPMAINALV